MKLEASGVPAVDRYADNIGRQEVAGKLNALVTQVQRLGECVRQRSFADAWKILDQKVAAREQTGQTQPQLQWLADNDLLESVNDGLDQLCWF